jgi:hypothetical protein
MKTSKSIVLAVTLMLASAPILAGEARVAVGAFTLAGGIDVHLNFRAEVSHWQYGLRFVTWTDEWETASGTEVSETTTIKVGPTLNYLFTPAARGSWYLGAAVLHWTQDEKSSRTGTSDKASTVAPFFGGGYTGKMGARSYYNLGLFLSPATLSTQTADTTEETTGADIQLQLGIAF